MSKSVVIVGGHGKISLFLAKIIGGQNSVKSIIRTKEHEADIKAVSSQPLLLSLEDSPVSDFTKAFEGADVIYFSAGAGGKGGSERTKKVDYEGAVKTFDAIEGVSGKKPRLVLVSAVDVRDPDGEFPSHYDDADKETSKRSWEVLGDYKRWKYEADKNLFKRSTFPWTIVRPGTLTDDEGKGTAEIGKTHISNSKISRQDVAQTLALLLDRDDAAGLALDVIGGPTPILQALSAAIEKKDTAFWG
ncbi:hypothetical protein HWV62_36621 [Athelia sp. TMB]|nr:hypothetical protein HWV62_36621 [Athelia sp. TMB]